MASDGDFSAELSEVEVSGSVPLDDGEEVDTSEPGELPSYSSRESWEPIGAAELEARLRLHPDAGLRLPAAALRSPRSPRSPRPLQPLQPQPQPPPPQPVVVTIDRSAHELQGSVQLLAEQQRLQAKELAGLKKDTATQGENAELRKAAGSAAERLMRAEAEARWARQEAIANSRKAQLLEEKLAFGEKQLEELKARLEEEAVSHRSRVGHLEEKLFLKESRASELQLKLETDSDAHSRRVIFLENLLASRDEKIRELQEKVDKDYRLVFQDSEAHARRAQLLEEQLQVRDEKVAELQAKVDSLREKKKELARKAELEQVNTTQEVRDQINGEIRRFQEKAQADIEAVRVNMTALHQKEVSLLQDRASAAEERCASLQTRLDNEEQGHQTLQLSFSRVRAELQNEITELNGSLKLKMFEIERAGLTLDEVGSARQKLDVENEQLRRQMEVLRQEYYNLELQSKEGRAAERAELATLREQLRGYHDLEKDLDATIKACAEAPTADAQEALLIGTTLGSAPASAQRRIQQSLLLAQELQRANRQQRQTAVKLEEAQQELHRLKQELEAAQMESRAARCTEPQAYLHTALRERQGEASRVKRELRACQQELDAAQQAAERAQTGRLRAEEDLRKLLLQRQHLDELRSLVTSDKLPSKAVKSLTDSIKSRVPA
ncbi:unnamed protein product [Effrenium voratum]|uniref:Uncharacterized protein n=1 Tax=Effrenium voratum TaxID=2562239 RepID=A0AA36HPB2_9DINO|nr:unnamed protein product [Effrenium voratum]